MTRRRTVFAGAAAVAVAAALGLAVSTQADPKDRRGCRPTRSTPRGRRCRCRAPATGARLVVSTSTGKPKPWSTGEVAGTCVDSRDHVFIVTRGNLVNRPRTSKGSPAPPVMEFDPEGNVVNAWGDRNVLPNGIHGCFVDYQDNIWIAGNGDGIVQKYTHNGTLLLQIGTRGVCDNPPTTRCGNSGANPSANKSQTLSTSRPTCTSIRTRSGDRTARQHLHRRRLRQPPRRRIQTRRAQYLRQWGGVAGTVNDPVTDSPGLFASGDGGHPHCVVVGKDDLVYVCDRADDRIQVFGKIGRAAARSFRSCPAPA